MISIPQHIDIAGSIDDHDSIDELPVVSADQLPRDSERTIYNPEQRGVEVESVQIEDQIDVALGAELFLHLIIKISSSDYKIILLLYQM